MFHLTSLSAVDGSKEGHAPCNNLSVVVGGKQRYAPCNELTCCGWGQTNVCSL